MCYGFQYSYLEKNKAAKKYLRTAWQIHFLKATYLYMLSLQENTRKNRFL